MSKLIRTLKVCVILTGLSILFQAIPSHGEEFGVYRDHPRLGTRVNTLPSNHLIKVGGQSYYYHKGVFYKPVNEYMIVAPPVGAVVNEIPLEFKRTVVLGKTYYTNNLTYFIRTSRGYRVVALPDTGVVTVNVRNKRGDYVDVNLKKSGNGFIGPRREYYDRFPKMSDLQEMYGK